MRRTLIRSLLIAIPLLATLTFSLGGCGAIKRFMYSGFDREEWQHPEEVVAALDLGAGDQVADLGAGGGYFTFRLAEAVGEGGTVFAIDVDLDMLEYIDVTAAQKGLSQIVTLEAEASDPGLPNASVDLIFLSNTYHHLPERIDYFRNARAALEAGGRIAVVELSENSFPAGHFTPPETIVTEMQEAGYRRTALHEFLPRQSFQIFEVADGPTDDDGGK
jgi:ubiquinone/menaquinone biosynthesis C-methylase UbiE